VAVVVVLGCIGPVVVLNRKEEAEVGEIDAADLYVNKMGGGTGSDIKVISKTLLSHLTGKAALLFYVLSRN
jgi:hypothetical protein